jgi:CRP-like cAMP-binding protein
VKLLDELPFFMDANVGEDPVMAQSCRMIIADTFGYVNLDPGETIVRQGDVVDRLYVIVSGRVSIWGRNETPTGGGDDDDGGGGAGEGKAGGNGNAAARRGSSSRMKKWRSSGSRGGSRGGGDGGGVGDDGSGRQKSMADRMQGGLKRALSGMIRTSSTSSNASTVSSSAAAGRARRSSTGRLSIDATPLHFGTSASGGGSEVKQIGTMGQNDYFGTESMVVNMPVSNTIKADERCLCLTLKRDDIHSLFQLMPRVKASMNRHLKGKRTACARWHCYV